MMTKTKKDIWIIAPIFINILLIAYRNPGLIKNRLRDKIKTPYNNFLDKIRRLEYKGYIQLRPGNFKNSMRVYITKSGIRLLELEGFI